MGKHGINAPPGIAVKKIEDLMPAAKKMADSEGEVRKAYMQSSIMLVTGTTAVSLHAARPYSFGMIMRHMQYTIKILTVRTLAHICHVHIKAHVCV